MSDAGRHRPGRARLLRSGIRGGFAVRTIASAIALVLITGTAGAAPIERPEVSGTSAGSVAADPTLASAAIATAVDVIRGREWWLFALHAPKAWRWSKGKGVTVAVLDTGVDPRHPDLIGQVITGEDFTGGRRRPGNKYWGRHGSAMASIIAGHGHGPGMSSGVIGIAPQAKILSIRVTWENDDPIRASAVEVNRTRDAVAKGIRYAVDHGANVINMSVGGGKLFYNGSPVEEEAIRYALSKRVVLIASAGNDGAGLNRKNFPAAYPGVVAVGAVDRNLRPWQESNRHAYVKIAAPGVDIVSADAGGGYVLGTGTSQSAAMVAGIAALIRSRHPHLTSMQVADALVRGTRDMVAGGRGTALGAAGVADAVKALRAVRQPAPPAGGTSHETAPNLVLIAVLAGGGVLVAVVIGLVLGLRRKRRVREDADRDGPSVWHGAEPHPTPPADAAGTGTPVWPPSPARPAGRYDTSNGRDTSDGHDPGSNRPGPAANGHGPPRPDVLDLRVPRADESWRPRRARHGRAERADPGVPPEELPTSAFTAVPHSPDELPTTAFNVVPGSIAEQPSGDASPARSAAPDELPTTAFKAVPQPSPTTPPALASRTGSAAPSDLTVPPAPVTPEAPGAPGPSSRPRSAMPGPLPAPDTRSATSRTAAPADEPPGTPREDAHGALGMLDQHVPLRNPAQDEGHRLPWS